MITICLKVMLGYIHLKYLEKGKQQKIVKNNLLFLN